MARAAIPLQALTQTGDGRLVGARNDIAAVLATGHPRHNVEGGRVDPETQEND